MRRRSGRSPPLRGRCPAGQRGVPCGTARLWAVAHDHLSETPPRLPRRRARRRLRRGRRGEGLHAAREGRLDAGLARRDLRAPSAAASSNSWRSTKRENCCVLLPLPCGEGGPQGRVGVAPANRRLQETQQARTIPPLTAHLTSTPLRPPSRHLPRTKGGGNTSPSTSRSVRKSANAAAAGSRWRSRSSIRPRARRCSQAAEAEDAQPAACADLRRRPCRPCAGIGVFAAAGAADRRRDPRRRARWALPSRPD